MKLACGSTGRSGVFGAAIDRWAQGLFAGSKCWSRSGDNVLECHLGAMHVGDWCEGHSRAYKAEGFCACMVTG